jgi:3-oxoacyl-[acyl-carrier protein] reductase
LRTIDLRGRVALVTGSAKNIGREIVLTLAAAGADVVVHGRVDRVGAEAVQRAAQDIGVRAELYLADLSRPDQVRDMVQSIEEKLGPVDILVHNAAVRRRRALAELTYEDWCEARGVILDGAISCVLAVTPGMAARGFGRIVSIAGEGAFIGVPLSAHVSAAKMGLMGMTRSLATEFATCGVTANVITLGVIDTERDMTWYPQRTYTTAEKVPMGRLGQPSEVADLCLFLVSDSASYITGQNVHLNGGLSYH